jgi:nitrite reductase/ring-hydroxylating ferredoxin subunit
MADLLGAESVSRRVAVGRADEIPPGTAKVVQVEGRAIAVFNVDGRFFAIDDRCPHQGSSLGRGRLDGSIVTCPSHSFRVDVTTGRNPKLPALRVRTFPTVLEDGVVKVVLPM